jgi:hypothetical protein
VEEAVNLPDSKAYQAALEVADGADLEEVAKRYKIEKGYIKTELDSIKMDRGENIVKADFTDPGFKSNRKYDTVTVVHEKVSQRFGGRSFIKRGWFPIPLTLAYYANELKLSPRMMFLIGLLHDATDKQKTAAWLAKVSGISRRQIFRDLSVLRHRKMMVGFDLSPLWDRLQALYERDNNE